MKRQKVKNLIMNAETEKFALDTVLGQGTEMKAIYSIVQKIAPMSNHILITGEAGAGKEKLARTIHYQSTQKDKPFIVVRCGNDGNHQLDQTLFGDEGIFNRTQGGTLLFDEISDLILELQIKLSTQLLAGDVKRQPLRLILATTKDLFHEVSEGKFREDLLYQINVIEIKVPPLRARKNDIPFLIKNYVRSLSEELGKKILYVTDEAQEILMNYRWKGNVRELQNVLERSVLLCDTHTQYLDTHDLPSDLTSQAFDSMKYNFKNVLRQFEYKHIQRALEKNHFDKKKTASELGLSLSSLYRKIEELSVPLQ